MKPKLLCPSCRTVSGEFPPRGQSVLICPSCHQQYPIIEDVPIMTKDVPGYAQACLEAGQRELVELKAMGASWADVLAQRVEKRNAQLLLHADKGSSANLGRGGEYQQESTLNRMVRYIYAPYTSLHEGYCEALYATLVRLGFGLPENSMVLDVGTGSGRLAVEYARLAPQGFALGLDISHASATTAYQIAHGHDVHRFFYRTVGQDADDLEYYAEASLPGFGLSNTSFIAADIMDAPLAPAQFDAIVSANTIDITPDPQAALDILIQLLRPGGRLIVGCLFMFRLETPPARRRFPHPNAMAQYLAEKGMQILQVIQQLPYITYWHEYRQELWRAGVIMAKKPKDAA